MNSGTNKLREIFEKNRKKVFVIDSITGKEFRYGDIEELSLKLATILDEDSVKKGEKIVILLPNCIEYIIIYFACMQIGAVPVPINQRLHPEEIRYILSNAGAKYLFISTTMEEILDYLKDSVQKVFSFTPSNERDAGGLLSQIRKQKLYAEKSFENVNDRDTIIIVYTSGTTSMPKGVVISYGHIISNGSAFADALNLSPELRFFAILDLAYIGGFYNLMLIPFICQGCIVLEKTFSPQLALNFWSAVKKFHVNALWLVPSMLSLLLSLDRSDEGRDYCEEHIKTALVGTAPLSVHLKKSFEERYSLTLYENYGLSETFFISTNSPSLPHNKGVGRIIPGCEVSIVDEKGNECNLNKTGEITVRTKYLMNGYFKNPEGIRANLKNGRFFTGDIGYIDDDGYLFITDRKKDLIIRGGINISSREIEEVIIAHPLVREVAVIGLPNKYSGEEVVAVIDGEPGLSEKDIKMHCQNHLALFKIPEHIYFTKEIPKSVTGKIQKNRIKDMLSKRGVKP